MEDYTIYTRKTKYYETDKMGIVHHSNYIRWLEECRIDFLSQIGLDYRKMEEEGLLIPVLSSYCEYIVQVKFDDTVQIIPLVESFSGLKFEVSYEILSESGDILHSIGKTRHCFLNAEFKPVRLKKDYPYIYEELMKWVGQKVNR